jgi:hypothetical protein
MHHRRVTAAGCSPLILRWGVARWPLPATGHSASEKRSSFGVTQYFFAILHAFGCSAVRHHDNVRAGHVELIFVCGSFLLSGRGDERRCGGR